jgi:hypothetical protein
LFDALRDEAAVQDWAVSRGDNRPIQLAMAAEVPVAFQQQAPGGDAFPRANDATIRDRLLPYVLRALGDMVPFIEQNPAERLRLIREINARNLVVIEDVWRRAVELMQREFGPRRQELARRLIPEPPGSPAPLSAEDNPTRGLYPRFGYASPELHEALITSGNMRIPFNPDVRVIFGTDGNNAIQEFTRFFDATQWWINTEAALQQDRQLAQATVVSELFRSHSHPEFQQPTLEDVQRLYPNEHNARNLQQLLIQERLRYLPRAEQCFRIMQEVQNYAHVIICLHGQHGLNLSALQELRDLGMDIEYDANTRRFTRFRFANAIPGSLTGSEAENDKLDKLRAWLERQRPAIDTVMAPIRTALQRAQDRGEEPQTAYLQWGHEAAAPGAQRRVGDRLENYDFIDHNFTLRTLQDGRIEITRIRTYYQHGTVGVGGLQVSAGFYNFHRTQVGEPEEEHITVNPNQLVACINHFGNVEVVMAGPDPNVGRSGLAGWRADQMLQFGLSRYGSMAMDIGMLVTGTLELRAALWAGRLGAAALGAGRAAIGLSGSLSLSPQMQRMREAAMVLDISGQLFSGRYRQLAGLGQLGRNPSVFRRAEHALDWLGHRGMYGGMGATAFDVYTTTRNNILGIENNQDAVQLADQLNLPPERRVPLLPLFDFRNEHTRRAAKNAFLDYLYTLLGKPLPQGFDHLPENIERLMTAPEDERQEHCRRLMAHFRMDGAQIAALHQRLRRETLTDADLRREDFAPSRRPNETQVAAALTILLLSVRPDGTFPDVLVRRDVDVAAWEFTRQDGPLNPRTDNPTTVTYTGGGQEHPEAIRQELRTQDLLEFVRRYVTANGPVTARRLAATEGLWHFGAVSDAGLAGVYRDAVASGNQALAMRALTGASPDSINFALLIYEMQRDESQTRTPTEQERFMLRRYGLTSSDLLRFLRNQIQPPGQGNADLQAAIIGTTRLLDPSVCDGGSTAMIHTMARLWDQHHATPGAFARHFFDYVQNDSTRPTIVFPGVPGLLGGSGGELAAAVALTQLGPEDTAKRQIRDAGILLDSGRITATAYNERLVGLLDANNPALTIILLSQLKWESLTRPQRETILRLLIADNNNPPSNENALLKIAILRAMPRLANVSDEVRQQTATYVRGLISPLSTGEGGIVIENPNFARTLEDVRAAAVDALPLFGPIGNPTFRNRPENSQQGSIVQLSSNVQALSARIEFLIGDNRNAFREVSPEVRLRVLEALHVLNPPNLREILDRYIRHETDPACSRRARELRAELGMMQRPDPARVHEIFQGLLAGILRGQDYGWDYPLDISNGPRRGRRLMVDRLTLRPCTRPEPVVHPAPRPVERQLERFISQVPENIRRAYEAILAHQEFTNADIETLSRGVNGINSHLAPPFIIRELSNMVQADGADALRTPRAQALIGVLQRKGPGADGAYYLVVDNPNAPAPLRQWAQENIDRLIDELRTVDHQLNLLDIAGNMRVEGPNGRAMTMQEWLSQTWPLLVESSRRDVWSHTGFFGTGLGWRSDWDAYDRRLHDTFSANQPDSLWSQALQGNMNALRALCYIIANRANFITNNTETNNSLVELSAAILLQRAGQSHENQMAIRGLILNLIKLPNLHPAAEDTLFYAIWRMNQPDAQGRRALSNTEAAEAYLTLLGKRIWSETPITPETPGYQTILGVQRRCISELRHLQCRDPRFISLLQALGHPLVRRTNNHQTNVEQGRHVDPVINDAARDAVEYLMEGVNSWLVHTHIGRNPDRDSTTQQRASAIDQALLHQSPQFDNVIEAIFTAINGLDDAQARQLRPDDPLVVILTRLMASGGDPDHQRLQLAAAIALLKLDIGAGRPQANQAVDLQQMVALQRRAEDIRYAAVRTLAYFSHHATLASHRREAREFLDLNLARLNRDNLEPQSQLQNSSAARQGIKFFWLNILSDTQFNPPIFNGSLAARNLETQNIITALDPALRGNRDPVEMICRACLGKPFIPGDPRLTQLEWGMRNRRDPRISAICSVLLTYIDAQRYGREAVQRLATLYADNSNATLRSDILGFLAMAVPELRQNVFNGLPANQQIIANVPGGFRISIGPNRQLEITTPQGQPPQARVVEGQVVPALAPR